MNGQPQATETEVNMRMSALSQQRNSAMDQIVMMAGEIAVLREKLEGLLSSQQEAKQSPSLPTIEQ